MTSSGRDRPHVMNVRSRDAPAPIAKLHARTRDAAILATSERALEDRHAASLPIRRIAGPPAQEKLEEPHITACDSTFVATRPLRNMPGVYAVIFPVNAEAATVSGDASQRRPGPERPL